MPDLQIIKCRAKLLVWLVLILRLAIPPAIAQKYFFDNYGIKQGLSEQKVYTLLQDSRDFIWLGTANGLSRFDGSKFRNFSSLDNLAQGGVKCIVEDSLGYIWFGHLNGGISRYDYVDQKFEQAGFDSLSITGDITSITVIGNKIWFTSYNDGAIQADFPISDVKHIKAKQFKGKDGLSDMVLGSSVTKSHGFICIIDVGMRRYVDKEKKFENYRMPQMTTYFNVICMTEDKEGNLWFGTHNGGIYKYIMPESRMEVIDLPKAGIPSNWISCLTEDRKGRMWVGTWGGGIALIENGKIRKFNTENGLQASKIWDIIEDVEGNILIADQDNGLTIYKGDAFITINEKKILPDLNVNAVFQDQAGDIWFGTNKGISRYTPGSAKAPVIYNQEKNSIFEDIRFFRKDRDGNLWIGANAGGVTLYNMQTSKFEAQPEINQNFPTGTEGQVKAMEIDHQNNLWIGTINGLLIASINEHSFQSINFMDSLIVGLITALYCDPNGDMWIGTERMTERSGSMPGLIKFNSGKKEFKRVDALSGVVPKTLVMDKKGILWVGTNQGLIAFRNDSIISSVTQNEGLLSNVINLLATGNDGSIYIGTNFGLNRYFPDDKRIYSYTERNGFTGIEAKPNAVCESLSGDLWFGTANGATRLTPEIAPSVELEPLTHIMEMRVYNKSYRMVPGMKLKYRERSILFDYYSICLTNPDVVRYKVKLEGADKDWQPVTSQTSSINPALPFGKYTFMVIACNSHGVWNKNPVAFHFVIRPPFYLSWWFILISVIIIVVAVIVYIKIREKNLIREKIILEEKVEERTAEVVQKSIEIEEKNRDITASIRYAERIQRAMLPPEDSFPETFVLFMPKDIVSGDFYWMHDNGDWKFIAACDCTGHGVPGAFMSIIGHNSLNKVVREFGITRPSSILDYLNTEVLKALMQRQGEIINDGMDMALIAYNSKENILEFSGAYNPLWVVRKGEVCIYKGDRFPIGMTAVGDKKNFTNHVVKIHPGDMVYMCTDGYADQFGSTEGKKYKSGNVKKLLAEIWHLPMTEQRARLKKEILDWKGNLNQVDDILFIGTRIPGN